MEKARAATLTQGRAGPMTESVASVGSVVPPPVQRSCSHGDRTIHKPLHVNVNSHPANLADHLRNAPPLSPRVCGRLSLTQRASHDQLLLSPVCRQPVSHNPRDPRGDWHEVRVAQLVSPEDVRWAELDSSVESATKTLLSSPRNVVLIRENPSSAKARSSFDYGDLNAYLLAVVGLGHPADGHAALCENIARRARARQGIPLRDIQPLCRRDELVTVGSDTRLKTALEILGGGVHRLLVVDDKSEVVGVLSQLRLVEFLWNEAVNFHTFQNFYNCELRELGVGSHRIMAVNADNPLADALVLMSTEGLSSVAVVDNGLNVVGNISSVDVKHLTTVESAPLLRTSCMHFISVTLSRTGMERGQDTYPVFYVNPRSSLGYTVAKLVATRAHRMWVVELPSPAPSAPATPKLAAHVIVPSPTSAPQTPAIGGPNAVPAAAMPGAHLSGRLTGVVSLTDILNLCARSTGLNPGHPGEQRARRRKSSTCSLRPSMDARPAAAAVESARRPPV